MKEAHGRGEKLLEQGLLTEDISFLPKNKKYRNPSKDFGAPAKSRCDKIRTCDLCVPNAALYQTEPRNEIMCFKQLRIHYTRFIEKIKYFFHFFCKI